jgi:hypothetical protein
MADKLNAEFIKRATRITSFNLSSSDFVTTQFKLEIQTLYSQHMFPSFKPADALVSMNIDGYNNLVKILKRDSGSQYEKLHNLALKGVGPGEAVMYLLTKTGHLGGGSSAGVDLVVGSSKYEVKAAKWKSKQAKDAVSDFKLGGNITGMTKVETDIQNLAYKLGLVKFKGAAEIKGSIFMEMKNKAPEEYDKIEKQYQKLAGGYFGSHETIFIQTEKNQPDFGEILAIKKVKPSDILMERFTSKSIKPIVKIK